MKTCVIALLHLIVVLSASNARAVCSLPVDTTGTDAFVYHPCFSLPIARELHTCVRSRVDAAAESCAQGIYDRESVRGNETVVVRTLQWLLPTAAMAQHKRFFVYAFDHFGVSARYVSSNEELTRYYANNIFDDVSILRYWIDSGVVFSQHDILNGLNASGPRLNKNIFNDFLSMSQHSGVELAEPLFFVGNAPNHVFGIGPPLQTNYDFYATRKNLMEQLFNRDADPNDWCGQGYGSAGYFNISCAQKLVHWQQQHPFTYAMLPDETNAAYVYATDKNLAGILELYDSGADFKNYQKYPFLEDLLHHAIMRSSVSVVRILWALGGYDGTEISTAFGETVLTALAKRKEYSRLLTDFILARTPVSMRYVKNKRGSTLFDPSGTTPLAVALCENNLNLVKHFVAAGFDRTKLDGRYCWTMIDINTLTMSENNQL